MIAARLDFFLPTKMIDHFSGDGLYVDLVKIHKCRNSSGNEKMIFFIP